MGGAGGAADGSDYGASSMGGMGGAGGAADGSDYGASSMGGMGGAGGAADGSDYGASGMGGMGGAGGAGDVGVWDGWMGGWAPSGAAENNEQGTIVDIDTSQHGTPLLGYNVEEYQPPAIPDYVEAGETESEHEGSNINSGININIKINNPTSGFGGEGNLGYDSQNGGMGVGGVSFFGDEQVDADENEDGGGYGHRPSWAEIRREYVTDSQNGGGEQVDADENQVGEEKIDGDENEDGDEQVDGDENEDGEEQIDGDENEDGDEQVD